MGLYCCKRRDLLTHMQCPWSKRSSLRLALAILACALLGHCFASVAEASCGDYLANSDLANSDGSHQQGAMDPAGPEPHGGCRGPNCHQAPDRPPLPIPQRIVLLPTRDALGLPAAILMLDQDSDCLAGEGKQLLPSCCGLRLFRPPRA